MKKSTVGNAWVEIRGFKRYFIQSDGTFSRLDYRDFWVEETHVAQAVTFSTSELKKGIFKSLNQTGEWISPPILKDILRKGVDPGIFEILSKMEGKKTQADELTFWVFGGNPYLDPVLTRAASYYSRKRSLHFVHGETLSNDTRATLERFGFRLIEGTNVLLTGTIGKRSRRKLKVRYA